MIQNITTQMLINTFVNTMNDTTSRLDRAMQELATGTTIQQPGDNPEGAVLDLRFTSLLSQNSQYQQNVQDGISRLQGADTTLAQITGALQELYQSVAEGSSGTMTPQDLTALGERVQALIGELTQLADTPFGNEYLFSGTSGAAPYTSGSALYQGNTGQVVRATAPDSSVPVNVTGLQVFGNAAPATVVSSQVTDIRLQDGVAVGTTTLDVTVNTLSGTSSVAVTISAGTQVLFSSPSVALGSVIELKTPDFTGGLEVTGASSQSGTIVIAPPSVPSVSVSGITGLSVTSATESGAPVATVLNVSTSTSAVTVTDALTGQTLLTATSLAPGSSVTVSETVGGSTFTLVLSVSSLGPGNGTILVNENDTFDVMRAVVAELRRGNASDVQTLLPLVQTAINRATDARAQVGAWLNQLQLTLPALQSQSTFLHELKAKVSSADVAKAYMDMKNYEAALQASLIAASQVLQPSLLDYLRIP